MSVSLLRQIFEKQIAEKDAKIATLRALLKKSEWAANDEGIKYCWCCDNEKIEGHAPDCELAAALKEVEYE